MAGKPTPSLRWKAAVLDTKRRVSRTPPGSKSGACTHRGSLETWESLMFPCKPPGKGVPGDQAGQALAQGFLSTDELEERTRTKGTSKVSVTERECRTSRRTNGSRSRAQKDSPAGSTEEGGEVKPKRPTRGKARSGIASCWSSARREGLRACKPSQQTANNR